MIDANFMQIVANFTLIDADFTLIDASLRFVVPKRLPWDSVNLFHQPYIAVLEAQVSSSTLVVSQEG